MNTGGRHDRIEYQPALDGLRGLLMIGIMFFHSSYEWAPGSFVTVSSFFTLSGFLIASLFVVEYERSGGIDLLEFWRRRFRRLMPAALVALAAIALFGATVASPEQLALLHGDILWALAYVGNWRFIITEAAYAQLFVAPSPVLHFWSLGIEEQLYFAFPIAVAIALKLSSGSRAALAAVLALLAAASLAATTLLFNANVAVDRIYYGTDTRAAELLLGALLGVWLQGRPLSEAGVRLVNGIGLAAFIAMFVIWGMVSFESDWMFRGGLSAYALISCAVIAAGVQPSGLVRTLLSGRALRELGRISYGVYLFHWPIFLWLTPERTGLGGVPLFALRFSVAVAIAWVSYRWVEGPIRTRRRLVGPRVYAATAAAVVTVVAATLALPVASDEDALVFVSSREPDPGAPADDAAIDPPSLGRAVPRVAVFGDSTAMQLHTGLGGWLIDSGSGELRRGWAKPGCGVARAGEYTFRRGKRRTPRVCRNRDREWERRLDTVQPDVVVVSVGPWDVSDRKLPGDDRWRKPGDPVLDAYLRAELLAAADLLASRGSLVVWLTQPSIEVHEKHGGSLPETPFPTSDPARMARFNELIFELESLRPGRVRVVDFAAYMRSLPGGEMDPSYRRDGVHFGRKSSYRVAADWLGPEILRTYRASAPRR